MEMGCRLLHKSIIQHGEIRRLILQGRLSRRSSNGGIPVDVQPTTAWNLEGVLVRSGGGLFPLQPIRSESFWQLLDIQGGSWMWKRMTDDTEDISWMATALTNGTLLMAADGSYNLNKSTLISGAGWIICCSTSGKRIQGSAYEKSSSAEERC